MAVRVSLRYRNYLMFKGYNLNCEVVTPSLSSGLRQHGNFSFLNYEIKFVI